MSSTAQPCTTLHPAIFCPVLTDHLLSDLYYGSNSLGQKVFTWVAGDNTTTFTGDLAPLVSKLSNNSGPVDDDYLGYVAFGSEALYSFENVTFYVPVLDMDIVTVNA